MSDIDRRLLNWPDRPTVYLTLDFECDFGTAFSENRYGAVEAVDDLVRILEHHNVPLTAFVQTELLDVKPDVVETLRESKTPVNFHPHSHTHKPRSETSIESEVERSTERFESFFNSRPDGYRFPNGNLRPSDYELLVDFGYEFDASIFPSWRPNHFDHTDLPMRPHRLPAYDLLEVPFTVYSDLVRIPTALSYQRLLGTPFSLLLERRPPRTVVYNVHMHDLVTPPSYNELSPFYRAVYGRNDHGLGILDRFLQRLGRANYAFETIDDLGRKLEEQAQRETTVDHSR